MGSRRPASVRVAAAPALGAPGDPFGADAFGPRRTELVTQGAAGMVPEEVIRVLSVLPSASLVVTPEGRVLRASTKAVALGLVRRDGISLPDVRRLLEKVRRDGHPYEEEMRVRRPPIGRGMLDLRVRVAPLSTGAVLVLVDDLSEERRVEAVRRDFVANVSHELKTPIGALSLLAEAVQSASDDPEAVRRFAARMQTEAARLGSLVNDIIDLSRLQGDDPLDRAEAVDVDSLVAQAVDEVRVLAGGHEIEVVTGGATGLLVYGDRAQLVMALRNLLTNAVHYSPPHTRVAVGIRERGPVVEIDIKDQGIGIPEHELDRIFERFYRVDPARSRATGGTGLGLAIVKHVARNHGGECTVWSQVGEGSTFTLRLPGYARDDPDGAEADDDEDTDDHEDTDDRADEPVAGGESPS